MHLVTGTTPTQYALAICFLLIGPAFGIAAALVQWRRRENVAFGMLASTGGSWLAWIVSCVIAVVLFPGYPRSGTPPEAIAMLFTLPGLAAGVLVLRWLATRRAAARGSAKLSLALGLLLAALVVGVGFAIVRAHAASETWPARRHLPESATVISEEIYEDSFLGDFTYSMTARMTRTAFRVWMEQLGLHQKSAEPLEYEEGSSEGDSCGATGSYSDGIARFRSWCS